MEHHVIRSYGRTRAHGLSQSQKDKLQNLYRVYGIELSSENTKPIELFSSHFKTIAFEIGFGNGEHIIEMAKRNPQVGFIGCEPFENGVVTTLSAIEREGLNNVRIYNGDARNLLDVLHDHSLDRVYILFPDPWRKNRHHKRRLISENLLVQLKTKIKPCGCLVIATDHANYRNDILHNLRISGMSLDEEMIYLRPACFVGTKYEKKAEKRGDPCAYMRIVMI